MNTKTQDIADATISLIDSLKTNTGAYGLSNNGSEYKIITEFFLYKYFNDKFGFEAKQDKVYGVRLRNAEKWDAETFAITTSGKSKVDIFSAITTLILNNLADSLPYIDEHWVCGCVSMPSNVFATTGTNVSVLFFDKSGTADKVILIDASKLGEEYKDGNNQKKRLCNFEIDQIVNTFREKKPENGFSVAVTYDEIMKHLNSLGFNDINH